MVVIVTLSRNVLVRNCERPGRSCVGAFVFKGILTVEAHSKCWVSKRRPKYHWTVSISLDVGGTKVRDIDQVRLGAMIVVVLNGNWICQSRILQRTNDDRNRSRKMDPIDLLVSARQRYVLPTHLAAVVVTVSPMLHVGDSGDVQTNARHIVYLLSVAPHSTSCL